MGIVSRKEHGGETVLAIDTGMTAKAFSHSRVQQSLTKPGYRISPDGTVSEWLAMGTFCEDDGGQDRFGRIFAYGPDFAGSSLEAEACGEDRARAWGLLHRCISAILRASQARIEPGRPDGAEILNSVAEAGPGAIICGDDGSILLIPAGLYMGSLASHGEALEAAERLRWTLHRPGDPGRALAFMTGALAYRIIAGKSPFESILENGLTDDGTTNPAASLATLINAEAVMPLALECPELRQEAAAAIDGMILPSRAAQVDTLLTFGPDYGSLFQPQSDSGRNAAAIRERRELVRRRIGNRIRKDEFFRKYRRTLVISGISIFLAGVLSVAWLSNVFSRPTTAGLSPYEVVAGYYRAIEELNQEIPGAYTARSVQTDYDTLTTTMYVTSRVRKNYERKAGLISPVVLFAAGEPKAFSVYGITGFGARELSHSEVSAAYEASFYYWLPVVDQAADSGTEVQDESKGEPLTVYRYRDTVELGYRKGRWLITRIVPEEREVIAVKDDIVNALTEGTAASLPWAPDPAAVAEAVAAATTAKTDSIRNTGP